MSYRNNSMSAGVFEYYIFEKNLQGDITAVYDEYGGIIVEYTYDAWGNVSEYVYDTTSNGQYNSFRYRGYFYDEDTELYYLNSRYYDPAIGRFLNPDIYVNANGDLTGFNMYAYCSNNPVMYMDPIGKWVLEILLAAILIVTTPLVLSGCSKSQTTTEKTVQINWEYEYADFDHAIDKANDLVYEHGKSYSGQYDIEGEYSYFGFECAVDIYYDPSNERFYLTDVYTDKKSDSVYHRKIPNKKLIYVANTHYHPSVGDASEVFSEADKGLA